MCRLLVRSNDRFQDAVENPLDLLRWPRVLSWSVLHLQLVLGRVLENIPNSLLRRLLDLHHREVNPKLPARNLEGLAVNYTDVRCRVVRVPIKVLLQMLLGLQREPAEEIRDVQDIPRRVRLRLLAVH